MLTGTKKQLRLPQQGNKLEAGYHSSITLVALSTLNSPLFLHTANRLNRYRDKGEFATGNNTAQGLPTRDILAEISTTFTVLLAIFFPSCTGK